MPDFSSLGISEALTRKLREVGIIEATPIQKQAIPYVLDGKDLIAQAQTGTGKTFAFVLPILQKIKPDAASIQALIVTPTRELALQITEEVNKLIADIDGMEVLAVYGGQDVEKQLKKLNRNVQIVVGTPGRLLDHISRGTVQLSDVKHLVLDEADQMLHIGFLDEVERIIHETPASRQTMLFSATMPQEIRKLARKHMQDPEYVQVEKTQGPADNVKQIAIHTVDRAKQATLIQLIETHRPFLAVIFCRTKRRVSKLQDALKAHGFSSDELHGDISQAKREQVMKRFRDAEIQLLVATDVAARGLDVEGVTHVFNYDIPLDSESYIHRIGRTGRAGMTGLAITLYASKDRPLLDEIEASLKIRIDKKNVGNTDSEGTEATGERKPRRAKQGRSRDKGQGTRSRTGKTGGEQGRNNRREDRREQPQHRAERRQSRTDDNQSRTDRGQNKTEFARNKNERVQGGRPDRNKNRPETRQGDAGQNQGKSTRGLRSRSSDNGQQRGVKREGFNEGRKESNSSHNNSTRRSNQKSGTARQQTKMKTSQGQRRGRQ